MSTLPDLPDASGVSNGWQALVLVVLIVCVLVVPSVLTYLGNRRIKNVEAQLKPNGGSSALDAIHRVEAKLDNLGERVAVLEEKTQKRRFLR